MFTKTITKLDILVDRAFNAWLVFFAPVIRINKKLNI